MAKLNANKLGHDWLRMTLDARSEIDSYTLYTQGPRGERFGALTVILQVQKTC